MLKTKLHIYPVLSIFTYSIITKSTVQTKMPDRQYTHISIHVAHFMKIGIMGIWSIGKTTHAENVIM